MKLRPLKLAVLATLAPLAALRAAAAPAHFGPGGCATLARSGAGSCVFRLACGTHSLSAVEFAFDCVDGGGGIVRHSYGLGGFDPDEEFDTEVHCNQCMIPAEGASAPPQSAARVTQPHALVARSSLTRARGEDGVVRYGPGSCVSTYRSAKGHCIMETRCTAKELTNYSFGLVCVDKTGSPVRHVFGQDSFDPVETFDTLIACEQCLGLEDIPDGVAMSGQVLALSRELRGLEGLVQNLSRALARPGGAGVAQPAPVAPAAPAAAPPGLRPVVAPASALAQARAARAAARWLERPQRLRGPATAVGMATGGVVREGTMDSEEVADGDWEETGEGDAEGGGDPEESWPRGPAGSQDAVEERVELEESAGG